MKQQLEDGIKLIAELIAETSSESARMKQLLTLMGTLQGLLIIETMKR